MNRRGFLAGVMGLCAGMPLVGRFVQKPTVIGSRLVIGVDLAGAESYSVGMIHEQLSDGSSRLIERWRHRIERAKPDVIFMSHVGDATNWDYDPSTKIGWTRG